MSCSVGITLFPPVGKHENVMFCWNHPVSTCEGKEWKCHVLWKLNCINLWRERMKMSCFVGITLYQPVQGKNENVMLSGNYPVTSSGKEWKCHVLRESPCNHMCRERMQMSCSVGITLYLPAGKDWKCHVLWKSPCNPL